MSSEEEEYTESSDEEEEYDECKVSQLRILSGKKRKVGFEEVLNVSTEPPPPLLEYYGPRDFRQLTQPDGKGHLSTSVATTSGIEAEWENNEGEAGTSQAGTSHGRSSRGRGSRGRTSESGAALPR
ncbi:hypothetical protein GIB67_025228 [Kingdonia uniflora]|uniref:Uncharacterized protein n=1 Tax=Kingdonia uniflora TaxID=39325 RepID=A0A7J7L1A2_9MAGN|nr:hypothetical protein GIB67_025228 [Kingdonia uniflora]